jgi:hypothetical protein
MNLISERMEKQGTGCFYILLHVFPEAPESWKPGSEASDARDLGSNEVCGFSNLSPGVSTYTVWVGPQPSCECLKDPFPVFYWYVLVF